MPERFGVSGIRNQDVFRDLLPDAADDREPLPLLDLDTDSVPVDWSSVEDACLHRQRLHKELASGGVLGEATKPLLYLDVGSFLEIIDRCNRFRTITLEPPLRDVYLECTEIRTAAQLVESLSGRCSEAELLDEILPALVEENLMFSENGRNLSLAVASRRELAVERIRRVAAMRHDRRSGLSRARVAAVG